MSEDRQERFTAYVEALAEVIGHADRAEPLRDYCRGLLLPGERKSVEPIAAVTAPARVSAKHQSLLHFGDRREIGSPGQADRRDFGQRAFADEEALPEAGAERAVVDGAADLEQQIGTAPPTSASAAICSCDD